jgi:signal peptidase I
MTRRASGRTRGSSGKRATPDPVTGLDGRTPRRPDRGLALRAVWSWVSGASRAAVALLLAVLAGLVVAVLASQATGLSAHVVVSGSMAPRIAVGDVVLTRSVSVAELSAGQVLLFTDPEQPGRLLLHRLVSFDAQGHLVTRGDANQSDDSVHVPPSDVRGVARLRVPYVGLPAQWRLEGRFGHLALTAGVLAAAAVFVAGGLRRGNGATGAEKSLHTAGRHRSRPGAGAPMTGRRPSAVGPECGTSVQEGRLRAPSAGGPALAAAVP